MTSIAESLRLLQNNIQTTARNCGRDPASIRVLAVSKTFPPEAVVEAADAGQVLFGENRIQEASAKIPSVKSQNLVWHLVGHLQSNKARKAVELFDVVQTVDSEKIARKLSSCSQDLGKTLDVLVQVNIGQESQKSGFSPLEAGQAIALVDGLKGLNPVGLMSIPPFQPDPEQTRPYFQQMLALLEDINTSRVNPLTELSMGMSGDYHVAIEEGATLVRLGTAIFGPRG